MSSIFDLSQYHEAADLEIKAAQGRDGTGEVPASLWSTYSAMANTNGGIILLGIEQVKDGWRTLGLGNPDKVRKQLWDCLNDRDKVSANLLQEEHIEEVEYEGKRLLSMRVPRATPAQRPVFVGRNPLTGTYRRNYEGDYRCDEATVRRMIADATGDARDARVLKGFDLADVSVESLSAYRNAFRSTNPTHPWLALDDRELLRSLGGWSRNRETGEEGLTLAGLLMFGSLRSILDAVPTYLVDYQERASTNPEVRWTDRVTTDGSWSGNLYDFYRRVFPKLTSELKVPFRMVEGSRRVDETHVHEALREALVNAFIHADFAGSVGILVVKQPDRFSFRNPGTLRLPVWKILEGGTSDCRNRNLQKMFQLVGAAEQAGSGIPKILRAWGEQHWRVPLFLEEFEPEQTTLQLTMVSLLPQQALDEFHRRFGDGFRWQSEDQRLALTTALVEGSVSNERLRQLTDTHPRDLTSVLRSLVDGGYLVSRGSGRWTTYRLGSRETGAEGGRVSDRRIDGSASVHPGESSGHSNESSGHSDESSGHSDESSGHFHSQTGQAESEEQALILAPVRGKGWVSVSVMEEVIVQLCSLGERTGQELAGLLARSAESLRKHYLNRLVREGRLALRFPQKPNHPNQAYRAADLDR